MGSYTRMTRNWLEQRFSTRTAKGHYFAHMPIYGLGHPDGEGNHVARLCRFLRILRVLDGLTFDTLLDVGGAEGYLGHVVQTIYGKETAITDLSHEACQRARELFGLPSASVDCARLPFADNAFDIVVCSEVLEHVENPVETMLELCRVARCAVVLTTEELRYDRKVIDDYLFKRPGWPHMERNLFHPDDFTGCLPDAVLTPQIDCPPTQEALDIDAASKWILDHTRGTAMQDGAMGIVATIPQADFTSCARRHQDEQLLRTLMATIIEPGHRADPPSQAREQRWQATFRDPFSGEPLQRDGDALVGHTRFPMPGGIPDFFIDTDAPSRAELERRVAPLPAAISQAHLTLRDRLSLPDHWPQDHFDLCEQAQRRGFWPNDQLVPREVAGKGFCWRATGNDPWVVTPCLMRRVSTVEMQLRVHAPEHHSDALTGQIFWKGADNESFHEECSVKFPLQNDGEVHTVHVDLTTASTLPEIVEWLRLDLADAACEIDLLSLTLRSTATC